MSTIKLLARVAHTLAMFVGAGILMLVFYGTLGCLIFRGSIGLVLLRALLLLPYIVAIAIGGIGSLAAGAFGLGRRDTPKTFALGMMIIGALWTLGIYTYVGPFPRLISWSYWPGVSVMTFAFLVSGILVRFFPEFAKSTKKGETCLVS